MRWRTALSLMLNVVAACWLGAGCKDCGENERDTPVCSNGQLQDGSPCDASCSDTKPCPIGFACAEPEGLCRREADTSSGGPSSTSSTSGAGSGGDGGADGTGTGPSGSGAAGTGGTGTGASGGGGDGAGGAGTGGQGAGGAGTGGDGTGGDGTGGAGTGGAGTGGAGTGGGGGTGGAGTGGTGAGGGGTGGDGSGGAGGGSGVPWCPGGLLLNNPSFEAPAVAPGATTALTGWSIEIVAPEILHPSAGLSQVTPLAMPADGNQVLNMLGSTQGSSQASLQTGITTAVGATYTLTFALTRPTTSTPSEFGGQLGSIGPFEFEDFFFGGAAIPQGTWETKTVVFTPTVGGGELEIRFFNGSGVAADDVYVDALCLTVN